MSEDSSKRLTIYDLARLVDSSPSTVSAVLNGTWQRRRISRRLAERILDLARDQGYSINMQARALRSERSGIIGMIVPMYDNRYFSSIAQEFEAKARRRGLFAIVSCTNRDPQQEQEAARMMLAYRVERLVCTGATDPDSIAEMCAQAGVISLNLDLPGVLAPSVISANREGARCLTEAILERMGTERAMQESILFIGGRREDHNTRERIAGFRAARKAQKLGTDSTDVLTCDYAADKAYMAIERYYAKRGRLPAAIFINSTISLEGVVHWLRQGGHDMDRLIMGCFDWDPLAAAFHPKLIMVQQDVPTMIEKLFELIETSCSSADLCIEVMPRIVSSDNSDQIGNASF